MMNEFVRESNRRVDTNLRCFLPNFLTNRWLALRLKFAGNLIVLFACTFAVLSRDEFYEKPAFIGLIITYSLSVTQSLTWMVRHISEMEVNLVSVERIMEYSNDLETEYEWNEADCLKLPCDWPNKGCIEFVDYSMRYRKDLHLILNGVNLKIEGGQKIGVVGRTGAGKSSLMMALFRIVEADHGSIFIDGVDTGKVGLRELREKLAIIPQDPVRLWMALCNGF